MMTKMAKCLVGIVRKDRQVQTTEEVKRFYFLCSILSFFFSWSSHLPGINRAETSNTRPNILHFWASKFGEFLNYIKKLISGFWGSETTRCSVGFCKLLRLSMGYLSSRFSRENGVSGSSCLLLIQRGLNVSIVDLEGVASLSGHSWLAINNFSALKSVDRRF